jgi:hypothetical protein
MSGAYTSPGVESVDAGKSKTIDSKRDAQWWKAKDDDCAAIVNAVVSRIWKQQEWRREAFLRYLRMYNNQSLVGWGGRMAERSIPPGPRLSLNVVKSCCDAFTAKLTLERPKCTFLTSGGDWDLQNKAKDLEKFVDGQFYEMKFYEQSPDVVLDACVVGTGCTKIYIDGEGEDAKVCCERTQVWELGVDEKEAQYGCPRSMYQRKWVDKLVLAEMFPDAAKEILDWEASLEGDYWPAYQDSLADMIPVHMAWHLKSSAKAKDGKYALAIPNKLLCLEDWNCDYFPFSFYRRMKPLVGFWGIGLAEELIGIQQDINMMIQRAQKSLHLMAVPKWWVRTGSKIAVGTLDNDVSIVRSDEKPEVLVPPGVLPPDFWQHLERQYQRSYELSGVNQLQAQSQKPAGLNSGKALDTYSDIASERFSVASRCYQDYVLECARQIIDRAREITKPVEEGGYGNAKYSVIAVSKNASQSVEFLKTDLKENEAVLQMYPTNKLAKDPSERMQQVENLVNAGMIDPNDAPRLLEFPDLQQEWNLKYASYDLCMMMINKILHEGVVMQPRPFMDLKEALKWGQLMVLRAEIDRCPEPHLQLLREWIQSVELMDEEQEAKKRSQQPAPMMPPGMPPGAPPGMPPPGNPMQPPLAA